MGYAQETGYVPTDISTIIQSILTNVNTQFNVSPAYTMETFEGTGLYKFMYAIAQDMQKNEVKTSEIFNKLQEYIELVNESISRPVNTNPGIIEKLETEGFIASVKPMIEADRGLVNIAIDLNDGVHAHGTYTITSYANLVTGTADRVTISGSQFVAQAGAATPGALTFQAATSNDATAASLAAQINAHATIGALVKATVSGAVVTLTARHGGVTGNAITTTYTNNDANVGATVQQATLAGGIDWAGDDDFDDYADLKLYLATLLSQITVGGTVTQGNESQSINLSNGQSFTYKYHLPDRLPVLLRLTVTTSENNEVVINSPESQKLKLLANIFTRYRLGRNFEPQRYYSVADAPWASQVLLEYSLNGGGSWLTAVYDADFDELFDVKLENISLVEN